MEPVGVQPLLGAIANDAESFDCRLGAWVLIIKPRDAPIILQENPLEPVIGRMYGPKEKIRPNVV
jgi:hypothetical protein